MIEATVICDSISEEDIRLTTFKLRYPRFIHADFMTHRVFSRNASSSRAIPTQKLIEEASHEPTRANPVHWGKNQKGMSAEEELDECDITRARVAWASASLKARESAREILEIGVHKQIVNRILEPFTHINVVVSSTDWMNFFGLRLHCDAQPEIQALARAMWNALIKSTPQLLKIDDWHLPFILAQEFQDHAEGDWPIERLIKVSVARCARVSYESFQTGRLSTIEEDLRLYDRLLGSQPIHASPAEHIATPDRCSHPLGGPSVWWNPNLHGNFTGWKQYRKMIPGEGCAPLPIDYIPDTL